MILKDTYVNCHTPLYCIDNDGYEYAERIGNLLKGRGYKKVHRGNPYSIPNIKKYLNSCGSTLSLLEDKYLNSTTKMLFKCECGKQFYTTWSDILRGKRYCNFCAKSKRFDNFRDYTKEISDYCESKGYSLLTHKINRCFDSFEYVCLKHQDKGIQRSNYDRMINSSQGCKYCGIESGGISQRSNEDIFEKAVEKVGFIYVGCDYNNPNTKWKRANIHYICPHHINKGVQTIKYNNLLVSNGRCKYCAGRDRTKDDIQNELDDLGTNVLVTDYVDYASPITAKCKICGHVWVTSGISLISGHRCPHCSKSNFEFEVSGLLDKWGYLHNDEYWFDDCRDILPLPFDFYLNDFNVIIEADGEGHYKPIKYGDISEDELQKNFEKVQFHDSIKTKYCKDNNIPLIRIPYWERKNLGNFLLGELRKIGITEKIAI